MYVYIYDNLMKLFLAQINLLTHSETNRFTVTGTNYF